MCPFQFFFKAPCPTCGVTRALIAIFSMDFSAYCQYNFMAPFLVSAVGLYINKDIFFKPKWIEKYLYSVLFINSIYYYSRITSYI
ncbi:MAG: DUF2752 domain-containing protein [Lachnospiraceae bacterium]|nr:DUF2752 domain-containing protein [Lachnospiraceae bacterium]